MTGNHHTAKMQDKGTSAVGMSFGWVNYGFPDSIKDTAQNVAIPVLLPELTFHTSLSERFEIGGRGSIQAMGIEGFLKWGFYQGDQLFLATAPTVSGHNVLLWQVGTLTLPLLATYEVNDVFSLHGSIFVSTGESGSTDRKMDEDIKSVVGRVNSSGMSLGMEFGGETFRIRPMVEFARMEPGEPEKVAWKGFDRSGVLIHLSWILGQEKKQLDRIEKKLDSTR